MYYCEDVVDLVEVLLLDVWVGDVVMIKGLLGMCMGLFVDVLKKEYLFVDSIEVV